MPEEIDNRYPEFARPYEPVGKGKRRKKLVWGRPFLSLGFVLIVLCALLQSQPAAPQITDLPKTPSPSIVEPVSPAAQSWQTPVVSDLPAPAAPAASPASTSTPDAPVVPATPPEYYTVTFVDYDGATVLKAATSYAEGTAAADITQPATPTRAFDGTYNYTFSGWSPALSDVTGNVTYTAVYESAKPKYAITWQNYDGSVIDTTTVEQGEMPVHADPTYGPTAQYTYTFTGWSPAIVPATADASYTATYSFVARQYNVTFVDWDGSVLEPTTAYDYNTPAWDMSVPSGVTRPADATYTYTFAGWSPTLAASVTEEVTYMATYTATTISYEVPSINIPPDISYAGDSGNWIGKFTTNVYLRDAAGQDGRMKLKRLDPDTGVWEDQLFGGDANVGTLMTSGSDFSGRALSVSDPAAFYEIPDDATYLYGDTSWHFDYVGAWSIRERMKVAFDYTFPNGETGTAEGDVFYLYKGGFTSRAAAPVLDRDAKTITMEFVYNVNVGSDGFDPTIGSNTWWDHHLYWQDADAYDYSAKGTELSLTPDVSEFTAGDGSKHVTVKYTLDSVPDNRAYYYEADLTYSDYGAKSHWNNWNCTAREYDMEFPATAATHAAPAALTPFTSMGGGGDSEDYRWIFHLQSCPLNDAQNAKVALRVQRYDEVSGTWVDPDVMTYDTWSTYSGAIYDAQTVHDVTVATAPDTSDPLDWSDYENLSVSDPTQLFEVGDHNFVGAAFEYHFPYGWWLQKGMRVTLRAVMDVEYADGTTETVTATPFYAYAGNYVRSNQDFGADYDLGGGIMAHTDGYTVDKATRTITIDFVYDTDVPDFDYANVSWNHDHALERVIDFGGGTDYLDILPAETVYTGADGKTHVKLVYVLSESDYREDASYSYSTYAWYADAGEYSGMWEQEVSCKYMRFY